MIMHLIQYQFILEILQVQQANNNLYIAGENLQIFANFIPKYLHNPDEYVTTVDGINITIDGFDAAVFDPNKVLL